MKRDFRTQNSYVSLTENNSARSDARELCARAGSFEVGEVRVPTILLQKQELAPHATFGGVTGKGDYHQCQGLNYKSGVGTNHRYRLSPPPRLPRRVLIVIATAKATWAVRPTPRYLVVRQTQVAAVICCVRKQ